MKNKNAANDRPLMMEKLLLCAHLAHTEIHLGELVERTESKEVKQVLTDNIRKVNRLRVRALAECGENAQVVWCSLKHLLLSYVHCHELAGKHISVGDVKSSLECYTRSTEISLIIDELIGRKDVINEQNIRPCPRCEE